MKHITFATKDLLVGDDLADALIDYLDALVEHGTGDTVDFHAISGDGDEVEASLLLSAGSPFMTESTNSTAAEPENEEALAYIEERLAQLRSGASPVGGPLEAEEAPAREVHDWLDEQH